MLSDALYNVVRPQKFSDVVGQTNTIKAIKTALIKGVLEHSLIFYGQTGGGKTTTARIVAKWLQCDNKVDNEPCCTCSTCQSIKAETFVDYVELNASTNGGKDDIDRLLENISYAPQYGKCKVYVIDEAHCLTDGAWKSLLKPLEEPPAHVYFILCTTDFNAIPQTIKNRCGKYEFSRITKSDILKLLCDLRIKYKAGYNDDALNLIAESADGSLRNAVNNFSHISMPFEEGEAIGVDAVKSYLALVGPETMADFIRALSERNLEKSMEIIEEEERSAVNPDNFLKMILSAVSDSLTIGCGTELNREVSDEYMQTLKAIASTGLTRLSEVAGKLNETYSKVSSRSYSSLRIVSAELCSMANGTDVSVVNCLLERVEKLEKMIAEGNMPVHTSVEAKTADTDSSQSQEDETESFDCVSDDTMPYDEESYSFEEENMDYDEPEPADESASSQEVKEESDDFPDFFESMFEAPQENVNETSEELSGENQVPEQEESPVKSDSVLAGSLDFDNEPLPFAQDFGDYSAGITFESGSVGNAYKQSQTDSMKAIKALKAACNTYPLLEQICSECCNCETTNDGVALATPFAPVASLVKDILEHEHVQNVSVYPVDGLIIENKAG